MACSRSNCQFDNQGPKIESTSKINRSIEKGRRRMADYTRSYLNTSIRELKLCVQVLIDRFVRTKKALSKVIIFLIKIFK